MKDYGIFEKVRLNGIVPGHFIRHTRAGSSIVESHWHPELELNIVFEGAARFFINGRVEDLNPEHMVLINSKEVHSSIPYFQKEGFVVTGVTMLISYDFLKMVIPDYDRCYFVVTDQANKKIQQLLTEMNDLCERLDEQYLNILAIRQISEIVYILATECSAKKEDINLSVSESFERLEKVLAYIHENYTYPLQSSEVAERFYYSKEYFCRFFKKYTGVTFKQYLIECRIIHGEQLLRETNIRISEVAQQVGFSDEGSFIRCFKKYYGDTPGNYRKLIIQNPFYKND